MAEGVFLVSPEGVKKFFRPGDVEAKINEGWKPASNVVVKSTSGASSAQTPSEFIEAQRLRAPIADAPELMGQEEQRALLDEKFRQEAFDTAGNEALAFGSGVLSGGTLGFSDAAIEALGYGDELRDISEVNPLARGSGVVAGAIGSSVLGAPGGLGRLLPGGLAARAATRAGEKVLARTGSKVGQLAAEGAIDAAIFGTGQRYADAVIADKPINVEMLIADLPSDVLFGGAIGGAVGGLGKLSSRINAKEAAKLASADDVAKARKAVSEATLAQAEARFAKGEAKAAAKLEKAQNKLDSLVQRSSSPDLPAELDEIVGRLASQSDSAELSIRTLTKADMNPGVRMQLAEALGRTPDDIRLGDLQRAVKGNAEELRVATKELSELGNPLALDAPAFNNYLSKLDNAQVAQNNLDGILHQVGSSRSAVQPVQITKLDDVAASKQFFDETGELTQFGELAVQKGIDPESLSPAGEQLAKAWVASRVKAEVAQLGTIDVADAAVRKAQLTKAQEQAKLREAKGFGAQTGAAGGISGTLAGGFGGRLGQMYRVVANGPQKIKSGVSSFIKAAGKPRRGTVPAASVILGKLKFDGDLGKKPKNRKEEMKRVARELDDLMTNPEKAKQRIHSALSEHTTLKPGLSDALLEKAMQRVALLHGLVPRSPSLSALQIDRWQPSDTEIDKFTRIAAAAENPYSILDDLNEGRLTQEAVDTVKQLYPDIYHDIQMEIVNSAEQIKQNVGYKGRLQLGILFQAPTDEVLEPRFVQIMQENYALRAQEQEQQGGGGQFSTPGSNQKAIQSTQTASQRLESVK